MLIRAQDKEQLINFNNIAYLEIAGYTSGEAEINAMYSFNDTDFGGQAGICLGFYFTKERAVQVLDQIQAAYRNYKHAIFIGSENSSFSEPIFEMPEV